MGEQAPAPVIPLHPRRRGESITPTPGRVLSLRVKLFDRAIDEALAQREANAHHDAHSGPRLRVVR